MSLQGRPIKGSITSNNYHRAAVCDVHQVIDIANVQDKEYNSSSVVLKGFLAGADLLPHYTLLPSFFLIVILMARNQTIDDSDAIRLAYYSSTTNSWNTQECDPSYCGIHPSRQNASGGTWHEVAYLANGPEVAIQFSSEG